MIATIVILAIALVGVANMVRLGSSQSANALVQTRAIALGQSYLDEIMGRRFDERSAASGLDPCFGFSGGDRCTADTDAALGPDGGESRRDRYDDVDDYDGLKEGDGEADPIRDAEGLEREGYDNFHVEIEVEYAGDDIDPMFDKSHAKLITVTVTSRDQEEGWQFSVYKANY